MRTANSVSQFFPDKMHDTLQIMGKGLFQSVTETLGFLQSTV